MDRYEQALGRANEAVKKGMVSQNFVDDIFGLESEDERIRKDIRLVIESAATKYFKETGKMPEWYDRIVSYLEKQKEQKPAEIHNPSDAELQRHQDELYNFKPHKWYIKKGHWYMCIVDKPEYGWTKGKVYQSPEDNRIETDYKGDLTNWPDSEPWFRPATRDEIPDSHPHWKPSEEQMQALEYVIRDYREDSCNATANYLQEILDHLKNM